MVPWLSRPQLPFVTLALTTASVAALTEYLIRAGGFTLLRSLNMAFANLAVCALALATLWPHSVPTAKRIGTHASSLVTRLAHRFLFTGYLCAFFHYVCSFALLADADYLHFARTHPLGVILAIFGSLFVIILSVQCLAADGKVKSFAIRINGVILLIFTLHLSLLNYQALFAAGASTLPADVKVAVASCLLCVGCLGLYGVALLRRRSPARTATS